MRRVLLLAAAPAFLALAYLVSAIAEDARFPSPQSAKAKQFHRNVSYGSHARQRLDLWIANSDKPSPLVLFFHGGDFRGGDKSQIPPGLLDEALSGGLSVASANYRLVGDGAAFPDFMKDGGRAIQFLRTKAKDFNLDPTRIAAAGDSGGGGIALWLAFHDDLADPKSEDPVLKESTRLSCAGGFRAQTTYDPLFASERIGANPELAGLILSGFFGPKWKGVRAPESKPLYAEASPVTYLTADDPPVFLAYDGPRDKLPRNAPLPDAVHHYGFGTILKERMDPLKIECVLVHLQDISRGGPLFKDVFIPADRRMAQFFKRQFERKTEKTPEKPAGPGTAPAERESGPDPAGEKP
ncbi:MAG: alpha/beta hydrolase fold domain-containing protein [Planctomycetota bacterium]